MIKILYKITLTASFLSSFVCVPAAFAQNKDLRKVKEGISIYENGYIDQPYVVQLKDNTWFCVFTTGASSESRPGQHVAAITSKDHGKTWSTPVRLEPDTGAISSWAIPYLTAYGRIYTFYNYNGDYVASLNGKPIKQAGLLGWYCYKYSDDNGKTWSERYRVPIRNTMVDNNNDYKGAVQLFWGIDKPLEVEHNVYFAISKLGRFPQGLGEGWYIRSSNLATEKDPGKIKWELLPDGEYGIRNPSLGSVQEEFNTVKLSNGNLYAMLRTEQGIVADTYSSDGGHSWRIPQAVKYTDGHEQVLKNPRACPRIFKCKNGKYLFWFHNHGGKDFKGRNPVWISGGVEQNGRIDWSQPEILLYENDLSVTGMSYPDLIEEDGKYWITETQKTEARVHTIDATLLAGMWKQAEAKSVIKNGLIFDKSNLKSNSAHRIPVLPSLKDGGLSIDLLLSFHSLKDDQVVLDTRDEAGKGILISTKNQGTLNIRISDGKISNEWHSDPGLLRTGSMHEVTFILDGGPDLFTIVVDGKLGDGGKSRQHGWGRFSDQLHDINGKKSFTLAPGFDGAVKQLRIYNRYLRTSEAISNFNALITKNLSINN